jgi:hypothetical protein
LFTKKYPSLPGVIALGSLFTLFSIEMWMHAKMPHGHNHGSATGEEFSGRPQRVLPPPPVTRGSPSTEQAPSMDNQFPTYLEEKRMVEE